MMTHGVVLSPAEIDRASSLIGAPHYVGRGTIYLLTLVYVFNMLDRQIITILAER